MMSSGFQKVGRVIRACLGASSQAALMHVLADLQNNNRAFQVSSCAQLRIQIYLSQCVRVLPGAALR